MEYYVEGDDELMDETSKMELRKKKRIDALPDYMSSGDGAVDEVDPENNLGRRNY